MRVWAYLINLLKLFGIDTTIKDLTDSAKYLPDWAILLFGPAHGFNGDEAAALGYVETEVARLSQFYTTERFEQEWIRKMKLLSEPKQ